MFEIIQKLAPSLPTGLCSPVAPLRSLLSPFVQKLSFIELL